MTAATSGVVPACRPATGEVVLRARGLHRSFGLTHALRGIDLEVTAGEILAVMGPSGSGKSTLLHVLAGVIQPDQGQVELDGRRIDDLGEAARARLRLTAFAFVFQFGQLLPDLSARDNVTVPLLLAGVRRGQALARADDALAELGLAEDAGKLPAELSGGQAQRIAVARALVAEPRVLFADEPTGSLDSLAAEKVLLALTERARQRGTTVVLITHDPRTAAYADREVVVRDGRLSGATA
ncbi:MAG: ABC transporter ATP-binding protein [Propionibacteriaceae bacterium]|jgi:putative ABC transport system ATP-binding protein|nr:ABC transporter ATP-binding protein [Propionibacteriaceae bacterium]